MYGIEKEHEMQKFDSNVARGLLPLEGAPALVSSRVSFSMTSALAQRHCLVRRAVRLASHDAKGNVTTASVPGDIRRAAR